MVIIGPSVVASEELCALILPLLDTTKIAALHPAGAEFASQLRHLGRFSTVPAPMITRSRRAQNLLGAKELLIGEVLDLRGPPDGVEQFPGPEHVVLDSHQVTCSHHSAMIAFSSTGKLLMALPSFRTVDPGRERLRCLSRRQHRGRCNGSSPPRPPSRPHSPPATAA